MLSARVCYVIQDHVLNLKQLTLQQVEAVYIAYAYDIQKLELHTEKIYSWASLMLYLVS